MEVGRQSGVPVPNAGSVAAAPAPDRILAAASPLRARDVQLYRVCEDLTEPLIYFMAVFSPWAFGTTQPWSIWLMNTTGYLLGLLLACKLAIRWLKGYHPPRWDGTTGLRDNETTRQQDYETTGPRDQRAALVVRGPWSVVRSQWSVVLTVLLAILTVAILGYCFLSALNARATFHREALSFAYHPSILWLPHSLDSGRTWPAFWTYLGLACSFWAIRDWLLGKSESELRAERRKPQPGGEGSGPLLPTRLRRLLWVLAVNGGVLGAEGIAQRLEGSGNLLFLVKPHVNPGADTQFGPYAYRANASQYFNLLWPASLGLWWTLNRSPGTRRGAHHSLLVFAAVMAACPIISTSRGGALVTVGIIALAAFFLMATHFLLAVNELVDADKDLGADRRDAIVSRVEASLVMSAHRRRDLRNRRITLACLVLFFSGALALGFALGWRTLKPRMARISEDFGIRQRMYEFARPMAADYPLFGTGPGTFETVFQLYRFSPGTYWPAQLHNDWLETRITFGWVGSGLVALALVAVVLRWFARGGIHGGRRFIALIWLALLGCLVHARYDFPFQIYSIVLLFLILCAILSALTRRPS